MSFFVQFYRFRSARIMTSLVPSNSAPLALNPFTMAMAEDGDRAIIIAPAGIETAIFAATGMFVINGIKPKRNK